MQILPPKSTPSEILIEKLLNMNEQELVNEIKMAKKRREDAEIKQYEVAIRARTQCSTISRVERCAEVPKAKSVARYVTAVADEIAHLKSTKRKVKS